MIIRTAKTRGSKYRIELHQTMSTLFDILYFVNNRVTGHSCNMRSFSEANNKFDDIIKTSAITDNIKYKG